MRVPTSTRVPRGSTTAYYVVLALAVLLDALTTHLGLYAGLSENGPLASRLLSALGLGYWLLELAVLLILYIIVSRLAGLTAEYAVLASIVGPWTAAWHNLGLVLRVAGVG